MEDLEAKQIKPFIYGVISFILLIIVGSALWCQYNVCGGDLIVKEGNNTPNLRVSAQSKQGIEGYKISYKSPSGWEDFWMANNSQADTLSQYIVEQSKESNDLSEDLIFRESNGITSLAIDISGSMKRAVSNNPNWIRSQISQAEQQLKENLRPGDQVKIRTFPSNQGAETLQYVGPSFEYNLTHQRFSGSAILTLNGYSFKNSNSNRQSFNTKNELFEQIRVIEKFQLRYGNNKTPLLNTISEIESTIEQGGFSSALNILITDGEFHTRDFSGDIGADICGYWNYEKCHPAVEELSDADKLFGDTKNICPENGFNKALIVGFQDHTSPPYVHSAESMFKSIFSNCEVILKT